MIGGGPVECWFNLFLRLEQLNPYCDLGVMHVCVGDNSAGASCSHLISSWRLDLRQAGNSIKDQMPCVSAILLEM